METSQQAKSFGIEAPDTHSKEVIHVSTFSLRMTDVQREQELTQMMADYKTQLMRIAYMYLGDESLAEDAVQDTFIKAYTHMNRFRGESSKKTWLTRIIINTCKDVRKSVYFRARAQTTTLDALPERGQADTYADDTVLQAVMDLSEKDKQVILLRFYQEMTVPEIARVLHIPVPAATSRLNRAKKHLKEALKGWYFDEE